MTRKDKILEAAAFREDIALTYAYQQGAKRENARLLPLITALADEVERLRGALEDIRWLGYPERMHLYSDPPPEMHRCSSCVSPETATKALTSPSRLDAFLSEGE